MWMKSTKFQSSPAPAPAPAPAPPPWDSEKQDEELQFLRDRHYFMHGEIIAISAITVFLIFLLFLVMPCVRRTITKSRSSSESTSLSTNIKTKKRSFLRHLLLLGRKGKADDGPEQFGEKIRGIQQPAASSPSSSY